MVKALRRDSDKHPIHPPAPSPTAHPRRLPWSGSIGLLPGLRLGTPSPEPAPALPGSDGMVPRLLT